MTIRGGPCSQSGRAAGDVKKGIKMFEQCHICSNTQHPPYECSQRAWSPSTPEVPSRPVPPAGSQGQSLGAMGDGGRDPLLHRKPSTLPLLPQCGIPIITEHFLLSHLTTKLQTQGILTYLLYPNHLRINLWNQYNILFSLQGETGTEWQPHVK